jgi:Holliday junction DNA helicase RuvA
MYDTDRMIAHLRGTLLEKHPGQVVLDAGGVGYDVTIPVSTFTQLPEPGQLASLYIHTAVREDAISLFGFQTKEEKFVFERLISVSGIGPKLAVTALSGLATADLINAIREGDVVRLTRIPGVGRKTAERMVVELRDKLGPAAAPAVTATAFSALEDDVLSALTNLGSSRASAEAALVKAKANGTPADFETLFRRALELVR